MAVRQIKKSWWVDFRFNYTRYRKRSPENSRAGALAYEATLRQKLTRGEPIDRPVQAEQKQTFEMFAWKWFEVYAVPNNKFSEQKMKRSILNSSLIPFFGKKLIEEISEQHIEQYKAKSIRDGLSSKTINNRLAVLSGCLSTAYKWLKLDGAPPTVVWLKCPPSKFDYLSLDECALLHSGAEGVVQEMILTALRSGMRLGELIGLQWASIDWQNRTIIVRHSMCYYKRDLVSPKSNRARIIPMDVDVYEMLMRRKRDTGFVFTNSKSKPLEGRSLLNDLKRVAAKVGLRDIGWHTLRHTFATHVASGGQLHVLQSLLGHSNISTTMRYAHVMPTALRSAIDALNPKTGANPVFGQPVGNQWSVQETTESKRR